MWNSQPNDWQRPAARPFLTVQIRLGECTAAGSGYSVRQLDYQGIVAENGAEAIEFYTTHRAELSAVLVDMMMPIMDGPATMRRLRQINPEVRILALSGVKSECDGVAPFIAKPITISELLQAMQRLFTAIHRGWQREPDRAL